MREKLEETTDHVNPYTRAATRRQMGLQVYLPLGLSALIVAGLVAAMWLLKVGEPSVWADALLVVLLIPVMLIGLLVLAALLALTLLVARLTQSLPAPAKRAQDIAASAATAVRRTSSIATRPLIAIRASLSALGAIFRGLGSIFVVKRGNADGSEE